MVAEYWCIWSNNGWVFNLS